MSLGEVFRTAHYISEPVIAKNGVAIEKGELVCNDGAGFVRATNTLAATSAVYVSKENVTTTALKRKFNVVMSGAVWAKKVTGTAIKQGQKLSVGANGACKIAAGTEIVFAAAAFDADAADTVIAIRF